MRRMQKILVFVFCMSLAVFLIGCGSSKSGSTSSASQSAASSSASSAEPVASSSESAQAVATVPNLVEMSCEDAVNALEALGLKAEPISDSGKMVLNYSNWVVVEQNPAEGETLDSGETVKLKVTKGKADSEDIEVPDLVGKDCGEANSDLEFIGLEAEISSDSGKAVINKSNWTVIEQKPSAGETVREGSVVELLVTKKEEKSSKADDAKVDDATEQADDSAAKDQASQAESVPKEYKTALNKAEQYSEIMHMSKMGIYDQLTSEYGEKYSAEAAQYAVDNMSADWNANALAKAREYQDMMDMSPAAIYDQLVSEYGEKFTPEEAQYAVDNL